MLVSTFSLSGFLILSFLTNDLCIFFALKQEQSKLCKGKIL